MRKSEQIDIPTKEWLVDAGCSPKTIDAVIESMENGDVERQFLLLKEHRCHLLEKIHYQQNQLDCLDCLLLQLKNK